MSRVNTFLVVLPLASLAALTVMQASAQTSATSATCASIEDPTLRLSCYDRAAGRPPAVPGASVAVAAPAAASSAAAAVSTVAPPVNPQPFGLYKAEHPAPPPPASAITGRVVALGTSSSGRATVTLEGGQLWELADSDPLLAAGDAVTIRRAALGSFEMTTPTKRTHRVHRLQ